MDGKITQALTSPRLKTSVFYAPSYKEPIVSDCLHYKMLKYLGFEHPCETHCLTNCRYIHDIQSFSDARICHIEDKCGNKSRHVEIVPSSEKMDKEIWRDFRIWQIRIKIIERNNHDSGVQDISFDRFIEEQKRMSEVARRPKLKIGCTPYTSLSTLRSLYEIAFDNGFLPEIV